MKLRILIAGLVFGGAALAADAGAELFQKAVTQERAAGNLEEAIKLYQRVAAEFSSNRALAAKALVQEARCYEKLGQDTAVRLYEQVAREYGDQTEQASAARERLAALGAGTKSKAGSEMMAHRIPISPTAQFSESDGRHVFYLDLHAGGLMAARMDGTDPHVILPLPANGGRSMVAGAMSVSHDGKRVAVNAMEGRGKSSFLVVGADGSGIQMTYMKTGPDVQPEGGWSPDGVHFVGDLEEADGTHVAAIVSAVDGSVQKIGNDLANKGKGTLVANIDGRSVFSPDGKYVVFGVRTGVGEQSEIRIVAVNGSYGARLVEHSSSNTVIDFTPDGKHLLFQSDRSGSAGIYALPVSDGRAQGEPVLIKQEAGMLSKASLSKDGALFYSVGEEDRHEVFTVKLDAAKGTLAGAAQVFPGHSGMTSESGAWSPDGQRFAYLSGREHILGGGEATLTIRTVASAKEVEYKVSPAIEAIRGWLADGRGILVATGIAMRVASQPLELHSISTDTGADTMLAAFPGAGIIYSVRPAPDGKALLVAYGGAPGRTVREGGLVRLDLQTGQQTELIAKGVVSEMAISSDSTQVAAIDRQPDGARILLKPLSGGDWKTLATLEGRGYMYLNWTPDGSLIFGKEGSPDAALFRISASGGAAEKIGELLSLTHVHQIQVHPDGRQLVFQSFVNHAEAWALENFLPKEMRR